MAILAVLEYAFVTPLRIGKNDYITSQGLQRSPNGKMAKILFTAIVADMRNKIAGTVFSKNRGGAYARTKVTPVNPQTTFQNVVRGQFTSASQAWRSLTQAQRDAWSSVVTEYSRSDIFGNIRVPSGNNVFSKLYINATTILGTPNLTPPPTIPTPELVEFFATGNSITPLLLLSATVATIPIGQDWVIRATANQSPGVTNVKSKYRIIAVLPAGTAFPFNAITQYTAKFGPLIAGQKVGVAIEAIDNVFFKKGPNNTDLTINI